jgi:putative glutamine amidotransferase
MNLTVFRRLRVFALLLCLFAGWAAFGIAETPVIGVIYPASHYQQWTREGTDRLLSYRAALEEQGAAVRVIGQGMPDREVEENLQDMDGLLLPGGIDVEPARYNEAPHPKLEKTDAGLDALEWRVLEFARDNHLPVLGICRGHQVINVFYGGSLYQDIPSQHQSEAAVKHRGGKIMHDITVEEGSLLHELLGRKRYEVNSYHHQAVKVAAPGFTVSARTADGIVEAIEGPDEVFIVGVQFHPEKLLEEKPELKAIFARFVQEAAKGLPPLTCQPALLPVN